MLEFLSNRWFDEPQGKEPQGKFFSYFCTSEKVSILLISSLYQMMRMIEHIVSLSSLRIKYSINYYNNHISLDFRYFYFPLLVLNYGFINPIIQVP